MLDAEADRLCGADRYQRSERRKDAWAGSCQRSLDTKAGHSASPTPRSPRTGI
jgi:hypothetical protein